jgi:predicted nucleic acid-binding protein
VISVSAARAGHHHRRRAADAIHLATAIVARADRFVTNNRRDFPDIDITYPDTLPDP